MKYLKTYNRMINEISVNENQYENTFILYKVSQYIKDKLELFEEMFNESIINEVDDDEVKEHLDEYTEYIDELDHDIDIDEISSKELEEIIIPDDVKFIHYANYSNNWQMEEEMVEHISDCLVDDDVIEWDDIDYEKDNDPINDLIRGYIGLFDYSDYKFEEKYSNKGVYQMVKNDPEFMKYVEASKMGLL